MGACSSPLENTQGAGDVELSRGARNSHAHSGTASSRAAHATRCQPTLCAPHLGSSRCGSHGEYGSSGDGASPVSTTPTIRGTQSHLEDRITAFESLRRTAASTSDLNAGDGENPPTRSLPKST